MADQVPRNRQGGGRRPGPKRGPGSPAGPEEVRTALLDAAERLFADRGVDRVSLRDVAAEADVQMTLIWRYVGKRDELVEQVYLRLNDRLVQELRDRPLQSVGFDRDTVMGRWIVLLAYYVLRGDQVPGSDANPITTIAEAIATAYGLDEHTARVRAAQMSASALGWRMFEPYLIETAGLDDWPLEDLRADLTAMHRIAGATPWPTPEPRRQNDTT